MRSETLHRIEMGEQEWSAIAVLATITKSEKEPMNPVKPHMALCYTLRECVRMVKALLEVRSSSGLSCS